MAEDHTSADSATVNLNDSVDRHQTNADAARGDFGHDGAVDTADHTAQPAIPDTDHAGATIVADEIAELLRDHVRREFDLGSLDADKAEAVGRATSTLRVHVSTAKAAVIEIGRLLIEVETNLPHGKFGAWLAAEFGFCPRTAQRWMEEARRADPKYDSVSQMEPENDEDDQTAPGPAENAALSRRDDLANVAVKGDAKADSKSSSGSKKAAPPPKAEQRLQAAIGKMVSGLEADLLAEMKETLRGAQPMGVGTCLMRALKLRFARTSA